MRKQLEASISFSFTGGSGTLHTCMRKKNQVGEVKNRKLVEMKQPDLTAGFSYLVE